MLNILPFLILLLSVSCGAVAPVRQGCVTCAPVLLCPAPESVMPECWFGLGHGGNALATEMSRCYISGPACVWVLFFGSQLWNINQPSWLHPGFGFFFLVTPVASSAPLPNSTFPLLLPSSTPPLPCLVFLETIGIGFPYVVEEEHHPYNQKSRCPLPCDSSLSIKSPLIVCLGASLEVQGLRHHTSTAGN